MTPGELFTGAVLVVGLAIGVVLVWPTDDEIRAFAADSHADKEDLPTPELPAPTLLEGGIVLFLIAAVAVASVAFKACGGGAVIDVVVADPPWLFSDKLPGEGRGAERHYKCLTFEHLCAKEGFDFPKIGRDAVLFLWLVEAMQREALDLASAWGFTTKTSGVWLKRTSTGKRHFGMGRYLRAEHERFLICACGKVPVVDKSIRSTFEAPVGVHSAKPEEFYRIVEAMYPLGGNNRHFELFARKTRPGWTQYGNEVGKLDEPDAVCSPFEVGELDGNASEGEAAE